VAEIWSHLAAETSQTVATQFLDQLSAAFEPVRHFPSSGPSREDFAPGLRVTFHAPYAIYYLVHAHELIIVRVVHGARDAAAMAARGEFR